VSVVATKRMRIFNKRYGELVAHSEDQELNATIDSHDDVAFCGKYVTSTGELVRLTGLRR
jgi:hypothetical protein